MASGYTPDAYLAQTSVPRKRLIGPTQLRQPTPNLRSSWEQQAASRPPQIPAPLVQDVVGRGNQSLQSAGVLNLRDEGNGGVSIFEDSRVFRSPVGRSVTATLSHPDSASEMWQAPISGLGSDTSRQVVCPIFS
ncbi:hypothetical protein RRG08_056874 [Elysia crispata]|uniref:Uncharacterized protein n=1 Tax=Elysia crispata TaxID=231223 RepID=A0AAE0ZDA0_9GAST|nr:hypothetical protein RRG08_056874 [Elysia crispata]